MKPEDRKPVKIRPNAPKIREALLHVLSEADRRKKWLTQFEVAKIVFFADQAHLRRYGRPITFDEYVAMKDGPVPSLVYDVLKSERSALREIGLDEPLWSVRKTLTTKKFYSEARREASDEILSESDMEELTAALELVMRLGYSGTWDKVHKDPAYIEAWKKRGERGQHPMDYGLLFSEPKENAAEELAYISAHV